MASQAQFTVESHTADGVQGSELAQRGHVHMQQMGAEEETKKLGEKNNDMKAEQPRWKECAIVEISLAKAEGESASSTERKRQLSCPVRIPETPRANVEP
ncbi:hypothetical protein Q5P01_020522 [Channa striata]|uniref:Uncharacterized protein n=1 Tax=Channa striata TaxID=64152 RepID=A0AA88LXS7_CHASR|nr:hypothetical protein Q5P01_020522 [Channa striata]